MSSAPPKKELVAQLKPLLVGHFIAMCVALALPPLDALASDEETPPPPDKSSYTLFNPVPDDLMRDFFTDRPTKSDSPYTLDAGHLQYEADTPELDL